MTRAKINATPTIKCPFCKFTANSFLPA
jgi:hypothetical protein